MDAQARGDLAEKVPPGAEAVLDVGCSGGATAESLRRRGVARIVGIEPDPGDAARAACVYDRVLVRTLEDVPADEFAAEFDAVLFGDVLEHLVDPSDALVRVRPWLAPGGAVVASSPRGTWASSATCPGRFTVPYSLLSGPLPPLHPATVRDLFGPRYAVRSLTPFLCSLAENARARACRLLGAAGLASRSS